MAVASKKRSAAPAPKNVVAQARGRQKSGGGVSASWLWETFKSIAGAVAIFLVVRTFFIEAYRIPSGSMIPTLLIGDWLFVNKLVYGPHIPFTDVNLPGYADPERGEVVVFESPYQFDQPEDPTPTLVKRLVGMPGDTLFMRDGLLHVNGLPQRQGYAAAANPVGDPTETSELFRWQRRYEVRGTRFGPPPAVPTLGTWGPLVVPPEHYFMLGDNRYQSKDSRFWGLVPRRNFRGRPLFVYYSWNTDSDRFLPALTDIRWSRIGDAIR